MRHSQADCQSVNGKLRGCWGGLSDPLLSARPPSSHSFPCGCTAKLQSISPHRLSGGRFRPDLSHPTAFPCNCGQNAERDRDSTFPHLTVALAITHSVEPVHNLSCAQIIAVRKEENLLLRRQQTVLGPMTNEEYHHS